MINEGLTSSRNSISSEIDAEDFNRDINTNDNSSSLSTFNLNKEEPISIYSKDAERLKIGNTQFEVLFPLYPKLDSFLNAFASFDKKEIIVEFSTYVDFIVENMSEYTEEHKGKAEKIIIFERPEESSSLDNKEVDDEEDEIKPIMFGSNLLYNYAHKLKDLITVINNFIEKETKDKGRKLTIEEAHDSLPSSIKERIKRTILANPKIISEVWESFLVNIAILNIKSVILCGEYINSKLISTQKQVIPLKFVPKLGSEFSIICKREILTLDQIRNKLIVNDLDKDYGGKLLVTSLDSDEVEGIFNYKLDGKNIYVPDIAEEFGYTQERYKNAEEAIIKSASNSTTSLSDCNNYLDTLVDYIDSLGALYAELKYINEKDKCVVLDFDLKES